ncbi:hypothetical protein [Neisseria sp. Ec49-e6-T10]|uniref:hypothetical protein n=1 Tax=Neisseria sp. Ec49-e6-T10 TaxID=3140744 RepID=UPI003EC156EE
MNKELQNNPCQNTQAAKAFLEVYGRSPNLIAELNPHLATLTKKIDDYTNDEIEAILLLDASCQEFLELYLEKYLTTANQIQFGLSQKEKPLVDFFNSMATIYSAALCQVALRSTVKNLIVTLAGKTLHHLTQHLKWFLFDSSTPDNQVWLCANSTYLLSDKLQLTEEPFILYENTQATTLQDLFIIINMLSTLKHGLFSPKEVDFTHRILKKYSNRIHIANEPIEHVICYYVTIDQNQPAQVYQNIPVNQQQRFWSIQPLEATMNPWRVSVLVDIEPKELKELSISLSNTYFLDKLFTVWQKSHIIASRAKRESRNDIVECVSGFQHILNDLQSKAPKKQKTTLDKSLSLATLDDDGRKFNEIDAIQAKEHPVIPQFTGRMLNLSSSGVGMTFEISSQDTLNIDTLISWQTITKNGDKNKSELATIIRLQKHDNDHFIAGMARLAQNPVFSQIMPLDSPDLHNPWHKGAKVILCKNFDEQTPHYCIVSTQKPVFDKSIWAIQLNNRIFSFQPNRLIRQGIGWYFTQIDILEEVAKKQKITPY